MLGACTGIPGPGTDDLEEMQTTTDFRDRYRFWGSAEEKCQKKVHTARDPFCSHDGCGPQESKSTTCANLPTCKFVHRHATIF